MPAIMHFPRKTFEEYQQAKAASNLVKAEELKKILLEKPFEFYTIFEINDIFVNVHSKDESDILFALFSKLIYKDPNPAALDSMLQEWVRHAYVQDNPLKKQLLAKMFSSLIDRGFAVEQLHRVYRSMFEIAVGGEKLNEILDSPLANAFIKEYFPKSSIANREASIAELRKFVKLMHVLKNGDLPENEQFDFPHIRKSVLLNGSFRPIYLREVLQRYATELSQNDLDDAVVPYLKDVEGEYRQSRDILLDHGARLNINALIRECEARGDVFDLHGFSNGCLAELTIDNANFLAPAIYDAGGQNLVEKLNMETEPKKSLIKQLLVKAPNHIKVGLIQVNIQDDRLESILAIPGFVDQSLMVDLYQWANHSEFAMFSGLPDEQDLPTFIEEKFASFPAFEQYRRIETAARWMRAGKLSEDQLSVFLGQGITADELLRLAVTANNAAVADYLIRKYQTDPAAALQDVGGDIKREMLEVYLKHHTPLVYSSNRNWMHSVLVEMYKEVRHDRSADVTAIVWLLEQRSDIAINAASDNVNINAMNNRPATLLDLAVTDKNEALIDAILARDDVDVNLPKDNPPLYTAVQNRNWKLVERLYDKGARLSAQQAQVLRTDYDYSQAVQMVNIARISRLQGKPETPTSIRKKWTEIEARNGNISEVEIDNLFYEIDEEFNQDAVLFYTFFAERYPRCVVKRMNQVNDLRRSFLLNLLEMLPNEKKAELLQQVDVSSLGDLMGNPSYLDNELVGHLYIQQRAPYYFGANNGVRIENKLNENEYYQKLGQLEQRLKLADDAKDLDFLQQSGVSVAHLLTLAVLNKNTQAIDYILENMDYSTEDGQKALAAANGDIDRAIVDVLKKHDIPLFHEKSPVVLDVYVRARSNQPSDLSLVYHLLSMESYISVNQANDAVMESPESIIKTNLLELAISDGNSEVVDRILARADVDVTINGNKPLVSAVNRGDWALAEKLFAKGGRLTAEQASQVPLTGFEWNKRINKHRLLRYQDSDEANKSADELVAYLGENSVLATVLLKSIYCDEDGEIFKRAMKMAADAPARSVHALSDPMFEAMEAPTVTKRRLLKEVWTYFSEHDHNTAYGHYYGDFSLFKPSYVRELVQLPGLTETRVKDMLIYLANKSAENPFAAESAKILRSTTRYTPKTQATLELRTILLERDLTPKEIQRFGKGDFFVIDVLAVAAEQNRAKALEFLLEKVADTSEVMSRKGALEHFLTLFESQFKQPQEGPDIATSAYLVLFEAVSTISVANLRSFIFAGVPLVAPPEANLNHWKFLAGFRPYAKTQGEDHQYWLRAPIVYVAYVEKRFDLVETLLKSGVAVDINYFNPGLVGLGAPRMGTLLSLAIEDENSKLIDMLLAHPDIDVAASDNLALATALTRGRFDFAERLMKKGATFSNSMADKFYSLAMCPRSEELLNFLRKHQCPAPTDLAHVCDLAVRAGHFERFKRAFTDSKDPALRSILFVGAFEANDVETMRANRVGVSSAVVREMVDDGLERQSLETDDGLEWQSFETIEYLLSTNTDVVIDVESFIPKVDRFGNSYGEKAAHIFMRVKHLRQAVFSALAKHDNLVLTEAILNDIQEGKVKLTPQELEKGLHKLVLKAIQNNDFDRVIELLHRGAKLRYNQSEALKVAASMPVVSLEMIQLLLERGFCEAADCGYLLPFTVLGNFFHRMENTDDELFEDELIQLADIVVRLSPEELTDSDKNRIIELCLTLGDNPGNINKLAIELVGMISAALPPGERLAFQMLVKKRQIALYSNEYAGESALVARANDMYTRVVKPSFESIFNAYPGKSKKEKIEAIEREIRAFILDAMLESAHSSPDANSRKIIALINAHRQTFIDQSDSNIMAQMRALAVSNTDNAQIAWRAYDPDAPCDPSWKSLLTKSWNMRERVAFYFIANPAVDRRNLLQQLADIRRAHNENGQPLDSHSCEPGTITRIARMGDGHSLLQLPPDRTEILLRVVGALVMDAFTKFSKDLNPQDLTNTFYGLTTLSSLVAEDIVRGKGFFEDSLMPYRERFVASVGTQQEIEAKVIEAWKAELTHVEDESTYRLRPVDILLVEFELMNIGGGPKGKQVNDRYHKMVKNPYDVTPVNIDPKQYKPERFRELSQAMSANVQKYIEFEMVYNACLDVKLPQVILHALIVKWIDSSFLDPTKRKQLLHEAVKSTALTTEQQENLFNLIERNSIFTSLNEQKTARVREIVEEKVKSTAPDKDKFNDLVDKVVENLLKNASMQVGKRAENR